MNHTSGDSNFKGLEICCSTLQNDPRNKYSKYLVFNGKNRNARVEIGIEPGMIITAKAGIETTEEKLKQILENKKNRKTEKQVNKQKDSIR